MGATDTEDWQGLTVRERAWGALGVVVGSFNDGPHVGQLRVHGTGTFCRGAQWPWHATLIYAIPREAVMRRTRRSLLLGVNTTTARARWLVQVLPQEDA